MKYITKVYLSWSDAMDLSINLAKHYKDEKFDYILSIGRGGLIPSRLIAEMLDIKFIDTVNIRSYEGTDKSNIEYDETYKFDKFKDKNILIVDDVVTTGSTINFLVNKITDSGVEFNFKVCCLYHDKDLSMFKSKVDFSALKYDSKNNWIVFPWESK